VVLLRSARGLAIRPVARLRWRDEARRRRPRGTTLLGRVPGGAERDPLIHVLRPVLLGSRATLRADWPAWPGAVLPAALGWSGPLACPRARTIPGSLLAARCGSCPHQRLCRYHDSRSPCPGRRHFSCPEPGPAPAVGPVPRSPASREPGVAAHDAYW